MDLLPRRPKSEAEQKAHEKFREEQFKRVARLKKLTDSQASGWKDFHDLLSDYIDSCKKRKLRIRLDIADRETMDFVRLLDREIFILEFVLSIPMRYVDKVNNEVQAERRQYSAATPREPVKESGPVSL